MKCRSTSRLCRREPIAFAESLTGVTAAQKPTVELVSKAGDSIPRNANEIGPDGQFEVRGVAPGSYVLRAGAGTGTQSLTARQDINVVAADVEGVKLTPLPSFTLSGHLLVEGDARDEPRAIRPSTCARPNCRRIRASSCRRTSLEPTRPSTAWATLSGKT